MRLLKPGLGAGLGAHVSAFAGNSSTTCVRAGGVSHGGLIHIFTEWSCKMAARWGTGEEMLTACKLEYFAPTILDESEILQEGLCSLQHNGLDTGDALEALHGCLDPSILSIFEDSTNGEVKSGVDDESEATLLTALTEILDNVDDENLSPFDTLPDMELLQGQKGCELSPSHGGEDGAASFSELIQDLDISSELDWCLPISLEQDGETVSVTLSDLVKHMHPYAMTLCVEGEEQLLPEGGIILEVMDKGEHGEPILAIPDLSFPLSLDSLEDEQSVPESSPEKVTCKHQDTPSEVALSKVSPVRDSEVENVKTKQPKKESPEKRHPKKKKKRKTEEPKPVEGRVLRSTSSNEVVVEPSKEGEEQKRKKKVTFAPALTVDENEKCQVKSSELKTTEVQVPQEIPSSTITTTANLPLSQVCTDVMKSKHLQVPEEEATPGELPSDECRETAVPSEQQPGISQPSEPKQKSLSLQQYRLLRQQKKPSPLEKVGDNSTKWPTLPEAPKELPPIPCLPDPNPKDPRRAASTPVKKDFVPEIMPAWQPRGPGAPPTPQALLVPPSSMLAASKKPVSCKSVSPAPTKPAENLAMSTSSCTPPYPQKPPVPTDMPENTIPNKVSQAAKQASADITLSLPMATTVREAKNLHAAEQAKCLQNTPSASYQFSALSKDQDISHTRVVPEITTITTKNETSKAASNNLNAASVAEQKVKDTVPKPLKPTQSVSATKPPVGSQRHVAPIALQPFSSAPIQARIMKLAEQMRMASAAVPKAKSPTAELIESFTSEIGIEASDLTSLLEQFEETQTKEEQNVPEVCGRAAAVGNSSVEQHAETTALKKVCSPDLGSTAGLTPPATPPHQMWKPLAPVALLGKPNKSEIPKSTPAKAIQIEPLPLPASKLQCKPQTSVTLGQIQPFSLDHDYCLLSKEPSKNELGNLWSAKQQPSIIIKSTELPSANSKASKETGSKLPSNTTTKESFQEKVQSQPLVCESQSEREALTTTGIVTPDASPDRLDSERFQGYSECSPSLCHQKRGRTQRKYRTQLPSRSRSTSSSSGSRSPPRKRYRSRSTSRSPSRYRTRSCSSSPRQRRYSYSSSSSDSWSRSRSRSRSHSRSPSRRSHHWNTRHSSVQRSNYCYDLKHHNEEIRRCKEKAIEERRVVYIGRILGSMTRKELRERFSYFGEIEECTVHFREHGDNYGFVTYYDTKDAFNAIENGSKLRQPNELPFDLCFGGRRQFCRTSYADLDSNRDFDPAPVKGRVNALDFDTLLKQAQRNLKR
ncbi:hypothetical protein PDJAM_G00187850 [Pangasius djambal]|uniref:Uncharacterized protein n=1 Tax=Pangasius djambal TaxID=1691987 RepID=A0ACC5Y4T8_9TELE|nr:hypothetical protein [Pangasius djambal]